MQSTIYFVHYSAKPGGIEVLLPTIINGLKQQAVKVFVIRPLSDKDQSVYKDLSVEVTYGSSSTLIALIKFFFYILKDRKGIYQLFNTGPLYLVVLKILGVKRVVYSIHGTIYWRTNFQKIVRRVLWSIGISKRTIFTSNSGYSGKVFKEIVNRNVEPVLLYNPIDLSKFELKNSREISQELKIIYVGRLVNGKNLDKWINTAEDLLKRGVNATFELYGAGPFEEEVKHWIEGMNLNEKIKIKGYIKNIEEVYKNADLLLFLSAYESFGNVVVESILCGTPVITLNIPSMKEIFKDHAEFLIENDQNYKEAIYSKIKSISELKASAVKTSSDFAKRFGSSEHINKLTSIYASLA